MPPKTKKSPGTGKKRNRASKRPSQTNLSTAGAPKKNNERSVMQTLEQEEPTNNDAPAAPPKKNAAQQAQATPTPPPPAMNAKLKEMATKTMMLPPPTPAPPIPPPPPVSSQPQPPVPPPTPPPPSTPPPPPPPQNPTSGINPVQPQPPPAQGSQMPNPNPNQTAPMPPAPRPPPSQPATPLVSPSPSLAQLALAQKASMMPPATQPVAPTPQPPPAAAAAAPVEPPAPVKKASREKDDAPSVDGAEMSEKRKKTDVINSWIRLVLQNGIEGLRKEYRDSYNEAPMEKATAFLDNPTRNRYHNIPCCDTSRVKLADDPYFYIHANLVSSGPNPRRFICTQAPLNGTIEDFWKMIIVSGLEYVVMLCELVEKGKPKSAEYFPIKVGDTMKVGKMCTITKEASVDIDKTLTMSTMRISKPGDNAVAKIVKHIHWHNWPDHGVPDNFLSPFRLLTVFKNCPKPIVVHCSAGVGRTGTLVLILIILESLRLPDFLGVPRLLTKLRDERFKSIQTEMQYLYVHRCILEYLVLKKFAYSKEDYTKFAKDYEAVAATCVAEK